MATCDKSEPLFIKVQDSVIIIDSDSVKVIVSLIEDLIRSADEAFKAGHYLEASMIMFQYVEYYLRLIIDFFAKKNGSIGDTIENLKEVRFRSLAIFVELIKPRTGISERLFSFNRRRNRFVHHIFEYKSTESLNVELKDFYGEGSEIIKSLKSIFPIKLI